MRSIRRNLPVALLLGAFLVPALANARSAVSGPSLAEATAAWKSLSADAKRRRFREPWVAVVGTLEKVGRSARGCDAALPLMRAARAAEELSEVSRIRPDVERARSLYLDAARACPKGNLADDALVDAGRLEFERLGDADAARESLEQARGLGGDMKTQAAALLAKLPAPVRKPTAKKAPAPAQARAKAADDELLATATESWHRLRADPERRRWRQNWMLSVEKLEAAGDALAPSPKGALAYMRAGKAAEELYRLSKRRDDAQQAANLYLKLVERCPGASLADDALVAAAAIESNRLGRPDAATAHLKKAIALKGDLASEARRMLREITPTKQQKESPVLAEAAPLPAAETPEPEPEADELSALIAAAEPQPAKAETAQEVRALREAAKGAEWSISEQVGLKVRRIVVDAGHGGHDSGAIGPTGKYEKDVTLAISRKLAEVLRKRGYEVVLTRDRDVFLSLEERTSVANRRKGDLFISIHANAHESKTKNGVETYTLNVASDRYAMRLAARENATTESSVSDLEFLLADLAMRAHTADSSRLAHAVQGQLAKGVPRYTKPRDLGVKHALFYVLLGARMPAILVETAFLSNPAEEKKLADPKFQAGLALSIADGIEDFVGRRLHLASSVQ